jgi:cyclopropane fatty-acyl-phospholipid synthase-like methyltransferase
MTATDNATEIRDYYGMADTRLGYEVFLRGTRHYGLYRPGDSAWNWTAALRRMEDMLGAELGLAPGSHVLDAGCGVGDVACHLAATRGYQVLGVEIVGSCVAEAKRRAQARGLAQQAEFRELSYLELDKQFPEATFDGAFTLETLIHAADPAEVLRQLHRVIKPVGRLVLIEYAHEAEQNMPHRARDKFRAINDIAAMPGSAMFEYGVLERLLVQAGFHDVTVTDITAQMLPMAWSFAVLGWLPYQIARLFRRDDKVINAKGAVEFWRYRQYFRYNMYAARR